MPKKKKEITQKKILCDKQNPKRFPNGFWDRDLLSHIQSKKNCPSDLWMLFHCCENRDINSSTVVSLQGFSKEAASEVGMDSHIEIRVNYSIMYKILYIEPTNLHITLQTHISESYFFDTCFEFIQRFRQVSDFYGLSAGSRTGFPQSFNRWEKRCF